MTKAFSMGFLGMLLCFAAPIRVASQEDPPASPEEPTVALENALSGVEARKLFEGNTERGEGRKGELDTGRRWTAFYAPDGTMRKREDNKDGEVKRGTWFVDSEGRSCFQWEGMVEPKCDLIVPDGEHYLRVRDGQVRGRIQIQEGNPSKL